MKNQNLTSEEQISIIESSLKQSSRQKTGASNYYIIWGAILSVSFLVQFLNAHFKTETTATLANISGALYALGGLLSFLQSRKDDKNETLIPINEKVYKFAWIGASIGIAVISMSIGNLTLLFSTHLTQETVFIELFCISILLIFGLVNFIIGGVTHFKPLVIGGLLSMLLIILIPKSSIDYKFLITAIGIIFSCLIPGILMKTTRANV